MALNTGDGGSCVGRTEGEERGGGGGGFSG